MKLTFTYIGVNKKKSTSFLQSPSKKVILDGQLFYPKSQLLDQMCTTMCLFEEQYFQIYTQRWNILKILRNLVEKTSKSCVGSSFQQDSSPFNKFLYSLRHEVNEAQFYNNWQPNSNPTVLVLSDVIT